jgi:hypothetical protein
MTRPPSKLRSIARHFGAHVATTHGQWKSSSPSFVAFQAMIFVCCCICFLLIIYMIYGHGLLLYIYMHKEKTSNKKH